MSLKESLILTVVFGAPISVFMLLAVFVKL